MRGVSSPPEMGLGDGVLTRFVAANLSFYLEQLGWDQSKFAKAVGVDTGTASRWLNAERLPRDRHWPKILEVLGITMTDATKDPLNPAIASRITIPDRDKEPIVRFLRKQANELGYDLTKLDS